MLEYSVVTMPVSTVSIPTFESTLSGVVWLSQEWHSYY